MSRYPLPAIAIVLAAGLATSAPAAPSQIRQITIDRMAFGPAPPNLRVGQTVEWVNADMFQHTATDRGGSFDLVLKPKARARVVLRKAGQLRIYCRYHPGMTMNLNVAP